MKKLKVSLFLTLVAMMMFSCASKKNYVYYNEIDSKNLFQINFSTEFQTDDLLMIIVSAQDPKAAQPFNVMTQMTVNPESQNVAGQYQQQLYLVNNKGEIEFPILGTLKVAGKTREQFTKELQEKISKYILNPIVNIRIMNYQIAVQGEVTIPGVYRFESEKVSLPEVLAKAGDLSIYGNRTNVLVIREINGVRTTKRIDLTKSDFMFSDFYYLKQNDIVYVEPNKVKVNSSAVGPNVSVMLSILSSVIAIVALAIR
ncbi:polysaccharide biosynthesis/export family protein [Capnocytophaga sp. ARDL2]|uniref:polysaccharide biosynthesis/export family protein n=1 Tax=Capnocytophaga sp. ARDL2 TaxID=3238809 RepID=UPI003557421A